jgi:hypothetical protein
MARCSIWPPAQGDGNALALWKRRGERAFDAEAEGQDNAEGNAHD